ncbi:cupin domain-containing protein [Halorussus salilacus]|uniref:cupin domain-containing protein n=1 Tax=Halorussus salilacus TaxID=2953750 RepID=UPI0020A20959|nr:cupin domain-containing protein [Halorussus salilacus]USZ67085.1 cupin domain-containing protein [Halorussus salilacus]
MDDSDSDVSDPRIAAENEMEWTTTERGDTEFRRKQLGRATGGEKLGCSLYELPPGKRSWPYHFHTGNEEAVYVLSGEGVVRTPDGETELAPGTYASFPVGEEGAHRIRNTGDEPLRYLAVSTMNDPDVTGYPDSGKLGVFVGAPPGGRSDERMLSGYFREDDAVEYWEGEE